MPSQTVTIDEAQSQFADLLAIVSEGGEVIITQNGKPLARLIPMVQPKTKRIAGLNRGSIWTSEDFDEPLPEKFWLGKNELKFPLNFVLHSFVDDSTILRLLLMTPAQRNLQVLWCRLLLHR